MAGWLSRRTLANTFQLSIQHLPIVIYLVSRSTVLINPFSWLSIHKSRKQGCKFAYTATHSNPDALFPYYLCNNTPLVYALGYGGFEIGDREAQ